MSPAIVDLVSDRHWTRADTPVPEVAALFDREPLRDSVVVVDAEAGLSLLTRARLLGLFNSQFGYALYQRKPVALISDRHALVVEAEQPPVQVISQATQRDIQRVYDDIIVRSQGSYVGLVSMRYLMAHGKDLLVTSLAEVATLEDRNRRLDELNRAQREFVANMTHELRAPLNTMIGIARLLAGTAKMPEDARSDLAVLLSSGRNLLEIVTNMLDLYKIEAEDVVPLLESVELEEFARECFAPSRYLIGDKDIEIVETVQAPPHALLFDPVLVRRVVTNLISNAAKFTERGRILLHASWRPDRLEVSIADTGIGISPADQGRLFEKFTQLESARRKRHGGTGLGLSIVRSLVELLGGSIAIESEAGKGCLFRLELPAPAADDALDHTPSVRGGSAHARVAHR